MWRCRRAARKWQGAARRWQGAVREWGGADVNLEEVFAALDVKLLHRRVGHIGKGGMDRLAWEGLVRGLEGRVVGEMNVF